MTRFRWTNAMVVIALAALVLLPLPSWAQSTPNPPGQISYQGFVTDANGVPLATNAPANYDIFFHIYDAAQAGNVLWGELQTVTVDRGYFSVLLGQGTTANDGSPYTNNLTSIFSGPTASDRYIGITVRGFSEIQPRLRLLSSPYSLLAANAIGLVGNTGVQVINATVTNVGINENPGNDSLDIRGSVGVFQNGALQFGEGFNGQDANAGKIGYEILSGNALDIVGAGATGNRRVKIWAEAATSTTGPLGVGTDTPATMLHVEHTGDTEMSVQSSDAGGHRWTMQSTGAGSLVGDLQIVDRTAPASRMTITTGGFVGIDTTTPGANLEVNGNTALDGYVTVSGNNYIETGHNISGKQQDAGKIGYNTFNDGALDIVGAGTAGNNRAVKIYGEGGTTMTGALTTQGTISAPSLGLNSSVADGVLSLGGVGHLNDNALYLRGGADHNHKLVYIDTISDTIAHTRTVDGAGLFGYQGGALGTTIFGSLATMMWDEYNIYVSDAGYSYAWYVYSDKNIKTNFVSLNDQSMLAKVASMPVSEWSYTNYPSVRHIGPMAQDFHAAFGGKSDKQISLSDEIGVALSAIKGLNEVVQNQASEIQVLKQQVQVLQSTVDAMKRTGGGGSVAAPSNANSQ